MSPSAKSAPKGKPASTPKPKAYGERTKELAQHWGVSSRTMQRWLTEVPCVPVEDEAAMLKWVAAQPASSQRKLTPSFRRRVDELRMERERTTGEIVITDPDYAAFQSRHAQQPAGGATPSILADLKTQAAFALFKIQRAQARGSLADVKDATEQLRYLSGVVHDEELRAQKLGREVGDLLPRPEVERIARALAYWLLRGLDEYLAEVCPRLATASASGPLFREEVRQLIEPATLSARVAAPYIRATQINAGTALPRWLVDAMREGLTATVEDASAEFARLYALPITAPPTVIPATPPASPTPELAPATALVGVPTP